MKLSKSDFVLYASIAVGLLIGFIALVLGGYSTNSVNDVDKKSTELDANVAALKSEVTNLKLFQSQSLVSKVPVGTVAMFPLVDNVDQYQPFVPCDGRQLSKSQYPELAKMLGSSYDKPNKDSADTFTIPNINTGASDMMSVLNSVPSFTLFSPKTSMVFSTQKGPLPLNGNFTTEGGDVVLTLHSTFVSNTINNSASGVNVVVDGVIVGSIRLSINSSGVHFPSSNTLLLPKLSSGPHTLKLDLIPSSNTSSDVNDYFTVVCTEMVPNVLTPPKAEDAYKTMFFLNNLGFFIKTR